MEFEPAYKKYDNLYCIYFLFTLVLRQDGAMKPPLQIEKPRARRVIGARLTVAPDDREDRRSGRGRSGTHFRTS
jgi:hypothetical protein